MRTKNIAMLEDTLSIFKNGNFLLGGISVPIKLTPSQIEENYVFLPDEVHRIMAEGEYHPVPDPAHMTIGCTNIDSFSMAMTLTKERKPPLPGKPEQVLVLNFANPVNIGGGVRRGANAQEEDLCRKSSLLLSLESPRSNPYYAYNRSLNTYMGSDALILTPNVEIIKDYSGNLLAESVVVSVLTCAAPMITSGLEGMTFSEYNELFYNRICGILKISAYLGYDTLVLGAFGCGAFGNDAALIADLFYKALRNFDCNGYKAESFFRRIEFAVLSRHDLYNFNAFNRHFKNYYRETPSATVYDQIRGSLLGGGAGDALGYFIEFMFEKEIFRKFGPHGITSYQTDPQSKKALISDDTQMTLFTANGILVNSSYSARDRAKEGVEHTIARSYQDWIRTQNVTYSGTDRTPRISWLMDVPEMYHRRAPGGTCLSGLATRRESNETKDFIATPINHSKGCGGVMRVAPLALIPWDSIEDLDMAAAQVSAITHSHPLGYMSSSILCHVLSRIVFSTEEVSLPKIIEEAKITAGKLFPGEPHLQTLIEIIDKALLLSRNTESDLDNIHLLGEGWVAEEALAIALYCSLKYPYDFSKAIIAAANHNGDSDSTAAITGNIVGALVGYDSIDSQWKEALECKDVMLELADDLYLSFSSNNFRFDEIQNFYTKYVQMRRPAVSESPVFFWFADGENGYCSNWYPADFTVDGLLFHNMEQFKMYERAILFGDEASAKKILETADPETAKNLGMAAQPVDETAWDANCYNIIKKGLMGKFGQNEGLRAQLLATGNRLMAEASPYDPINGIGLSAEDALNTPMEQWPGTNLLGKALMEVRTLLR